MGCCPCGDLLLRDVVFRIDLEEVVNNNEYHCCRAKEYG